MTRAQRTLGRAAMAALTTAEEDALRRALGAMPNKADLYIRRAAEKTLGVAEGSLDAKRSLVKDFCQAEMVRAPPSLAFGDKGLMVQFTPPSGVSHAALHLWSTATNCSTTATK